MALKFQNLKIYNFGRTLQWRNSNILLSYTGSETTLFWSPNPIITGVWQSLGLLVGGGEGGGAKWFSTVKNVKITEDVKTITEDDQTNYWKIENIFEESEFTWRLQPTNIQNNSSNHFLNHDFEYISSSGV